MTNALLAILIVILVAGAIAMLIRKAPFIDEPFKTWGVYLVLVFAVLYILFRVLPLLGVAV